MGSQTELTPLPYECKACARCKQTLVFSDTCSGLSESYLACRQLGRDPAYPRQRGQPCGRRVCSEAGYGCPRRCGGHVLVTRSLLCSWCGLKLAC